MVALSAPVLAIATTPIWPTYHYDLHHTGQNPNSTDIKGTDPNPGGIHDSSYHGPSSLNLIWTYPRLEFGAGVVDKALPTIDNANTNNAGPLFSSTGTWSTDTTAAWTVSTDDRLPYPTTDDVPGASVARDWLSANATTNSADPDIPTATWAFPTALPRGKYLIYVRIPYHNETTDPNQNTNGTKAAHYRIVDDQGVHDVTYDQSSAGSSTSSAVGWQLLSSNAYWFSGTSITGLPEGVQLTALVDALNKDDAGAVLPTKVLADAIRFFRVGEIYASPVSADMGLPNPDPTSIPGTVWPNTTTCAFFGTVEPIRPGTNDSVNLRDIVDDTGAVFAPAASWQNVVSGLGNPHGGTYHTTPIVTDPAGGVPTVTWRFPAWLPKGQYQVYVYVPYNKDEGVPANNTDGTQDATYTITDDAGPHTVHYDQSSGGLWEQLSPDTFTFGGTGNEGVTLSAYVPNQAAAGGHVLADAIRFKWVADSHDEGGLYCVYGHTATLMPESGWGSSTDDYKAVTKYLGQPVWRYPRNSMEEFLPDGTTRNPSYVGNRDKIEGPVQGGFYSSPVLANVKIGSGPPDLVCFASGMDRQLYAIKADTGELLWKGPGVTVPEDDATNIDGWVKTAVRADAFGGTFRYTPCSDGIAGNVNWCTWNVAGTDLQNAAPSGAQGLSYAVYAWIPESGGTGGLLRSRTATYTITYQDKNGDANESATVTVDQGDPQVAGTWVKLGGSYFNPTQVTLTNTATPEVSATNPKLVTDYAVVADAIMLVPNSIEGLGYSSPVTDAEGDPATTNAENVFVMSENGRAMSFFASPLDNHVGHLNWVYPSIQTVRVITGPAMGDQPAWGDIGASMAYSQDKLYAATADGTVRCISGAKSGNASQLWVFPSGSNTDENSGGFTSSPALDGSRLFIGSTDGIFYCLNMANGNLLWQYPPANSPSSDTPYQSPPLGGFRYSTPAIATVQNGGTPGAGIERVWCGSSDGHIYSFEASNGQRLYIDDAGTRHGAQEYNEPSLLNPIQGSVAIDGATASGDNPIMYVGDMNGTLHWRDAVTGSKQNWEYAGWNTPGMLFSSPNITNTQFGTTKLSWIYIGCGDGHLMAFTHGGLNSAYGGEWQGGDWPYPGSEPNENSNKVEAAPETAIQFEMVNEDFYNRTHDFNPEPVDASGNPDAAAIGAWPSDFGNDAVVVSKAMKVIGSSVNTSVDQDVIDELTKQATYRRQTAFLPTGRGVGTQPYFEWGESIYMVLWNLPERKFINGGTSGIKVTMTNASAGGSAGTSMSFSGTTTHIKDYTVVEDKGGTYAVLNDSSGNPVRRSYALVRLDIDGTRTSDPLPPPPGPGWNVSVEFRKQDSTGGNVTRLMMPLPELTGPTGTPQHLEIKQVAVSGSTNNEVKPASIGINNPLAIRDDGFSAGKPLQPVAIGWNDGVHPNRQNPDVHVNGNMSWTTVNGSLNMSYTPRPMIDLYLVPHGTSSREATLGVMDRSATGMVANRRLTRFRIDNGDLRFRGWPYSVEAQALDALGAPVMSSGGPVKYGIRFPWDGGQGSVDYPDIYRKYQSYHHVSSDNDATSTGCTLWGVTKDASYTGPDPFAHSLLTSDAVIVSVDVPRFQPANVWDDPNPSGTRSSSGYSRNMTAYIDSNGNGSCDTGNTTRGAPTTWQEAYRQFRVQVKVPPDPKLEVDEQLVDIGRAPHGLGEPPLSPLEFCAYNPSPEIQRWFKPLTIKNAGNVNLYNIRINQALDLYGDQASPSAVLPGLAITSSLDPVIFSPRFQVFADYNYPFVSQGQMADGTNVTLGYTLSKPRVGDPDPTVMTIPDTRPWSMNYGGMADKAGPVIQGLGWSKAEPLTPEVSVRVPLTQPIGTYQSWNTKDQIPYVAVFSDVVGSGVPSAGDPIAMPSFQLKVAVRENQLTGGVTPTTLPQIDHITSGPTTVDSLPKVGDSTPAAFRDANGAINLYWSSNLFWAMNRNFTGTSYPLTPEQRASAPWFLDYATLGYGNQNWRNIDDFHWWQTSGNPTPINEWAPSAVPTGFSLLPWPDAGSAKHSVKHYSPSIGENLAVPCTDDVNRTWLVWAGTADIKDNTTNKVSQSHVISYLDVTKGPSENASVISHDLSQVKRSPAAVPDGNRMWVFWQGGDNGSWSIDYTYSSAGPTFPTSSWQPDLKLRTPDCMASVGQPNPLLRHWWVDLIGADDYNQSFTDAYRDTLSHATKMFDVIYAGTNKLTHNSDIILSRYVAARPSDPAAVQPSRTAQPLPRVFNESLARDPKFGFYTSHHIVWMRAPKGGALGIDDWGGYAVNSPTRDLPYVRVFFPDGYDDGTIQLPANTAISATDGSVWTGAKEMDAGKVITPDIDDATGIYTYTYPSGGLADQVLGKMLVDFSSGIVRFTKPLKETKLADGKISTPEVHADYTPQAWRITTDAAADGSPRAFIEHTSMTDPSGIAVVGGLDVTWPRKKPAPVDRLWVFWRKTGTAVDSSTIFYTTMRIGVDLAKLGLPPIAVDPTTGQVSDGANLRITGQLGPYEVDRTGTKVYFSEVDERYRSLVGVAGLPMPVDPPRISYDCFGGPNIRDVPLTDISWITELPEQSLFGFAADSNVNEGSIYAFADPNPKESGTSSRILSSKIWVFWTSTRGGNSDLFWETLSPNLWGR